MAKSGSQSRKKVVLDILVLLIIVLSTTWLFRESSMEPAKGNTFYNEDTRVFSHVDVGEDGKILSISGKQGYFSFFEGASFLS